MDLPLDIQVEKAIRSDRVKRERRLYEVVGLIAQKLPDKDPVEIMRTVTAWKDKEGRRRNQRWRPEMLNDAHLDRSIKDAEEWLEAERG